MIKRLQHEYTDLLKDIISVIQYLEEVMVQFIVVQDKNKWMHKMVAIT